MSKKKESIKINIQKPFIKWVGGKTQIIDDVIASFPSEINNYHELFLGGGSVLLAILSLKKQGVIKINNKIYAYDLNHLLINLYKHIQTEKDAIFNYITQYKTEYDSIKGEVVKGKNRELPPHETKEDAMKSKPAYYYWLRNKFNNMDKNTVEYSAIFIVINKLCFRGVYREGKKGYNVPFGHYKTTPTIITKEELDNISELIKDVEFIKSDFNDSIIKAEPGDFVYMDPPYAPESSKSFVGYTADGFDLNTHKKLFEEIKKLAGKNIKFSMSNARVDLVTDTFKEEDGYIYKNIIARRAINSKDPSDVTTEVIIRN